jgi:hypothetical protein
VRNGEVQMIPEEESFTRPRVPANRDEQPAAVVAEC